MGTWGTGPFDSDMAEDVVDQLESLPARRIDVLTDRLERAASAQPDELLGEVLAAAAVVAANLPAGRDLPWNDDYPGITTWLSGDQAESLALLARRALDMRFRPDGGYRRSWVDDAERRERHAAYEQIRLVLTMGSSR